MQNILIYKMNDRGRFIIARLEFILLHFFESYHTITLFIDYLIINYLIHFCVLFESQIIQIFN